MKYMLSIYMEEDALAEAEREDCYRESAQLAHDLHKQGQYVAAAPLHPVSTAKSVRVRNGKPLITAGPFAETREALGGYFIVEAQSMEEALSIAARIPGARTGTVEVRPLVELSGMPEDVGATTELAAL